MRTQKIPNNEKYVKSTKQTGDILNASEWNSLALAAETALTKVNSIIDDVAAVDCCVILDSNSTFASQVDYNDNTHEGLIFVIRDAFNLGNSTVTMAKDCTLKFENGGAVSNGNLVLHNTRIEGNATFTNVNISGSCANEVLTPQMFGASAWKDASSDISKITADTKAFKNLATVLDDANTISKAVYIPSGHYSINERIDILSSCNVYGDGETSVIDIYNGAGGLYFGYNGNDAYANSCEMLNCTITADAEIGDEQLTLDSVSGINAGDYLILTDTLDYSFNGSRPYFRTSEIVRVKSISGTTVSLYSKIYGNYYIETISAMKSRLDNDPNIKTTIENAPSWRTIIGKFTPKTFNISNIKVYSHSHSISNPTSYYTFAVCGFANSEFKGVIVENYGNKVAGTFMAGINYTVNLCSFKNYCDYVTDSYGCAFIGGQDYLVCDSSFRGESHALATGGNGSMFSINNRNFVYERLRFDSIGNGQMALDVHGNSELYKYVDIYAPHITCDTGGYNISIEGCKFYTISSTFNLDGIKITNCEIMNANSLGYLLLSNSHIIPGHESSTMVVENSTIHGSFVVDMQDASVNNYSNKNTSHPYSNFIFKNNICESVELRHGYMQTVVIEDNTFSDGCFAGSYDVCMDSLSIKNNVFINGIVQFASGVPVNGNVMLNTITHRTQPANHPDTYTILLTNFNGMLSNNIINRVINDNTETMYFGAKSTARIFDNTINIKNENKAIVYSAQGSNVTFSRNVHNSLNYTLVYIPTNNGEVLAHGVHDNIKRYNAEFNKAMAIEDAVGTPVYFKDSNKLGIISIAKSGPAVLYSRDNNEHPKSDRPYIGNNVLVGGNMYNFQISATGVHTLYYSKTNDTSAADFEEGLLKIAVADGNILTAFTAPDPTDYPYLYVTTTAAIGGLQIWLNRSVSQYDGAAADVIRYGTSSQRSSIAGNDIYNGFVFYDTTLNKPMYCYARNETSTNAAYWKEADGALAGTLRIGTTSQRPSGNNIYVGFEYMDTDLGRKIYASAISGSTVTWSEIGEGSTAISKMGDTASRPIGSKIYEGFMYNDTDIHKLIFASTISGDTVTWVDVDGNDVSISQS